MPTQPTQPPRPPTPPPAQPRPQAPPPPAPQQQPKPEADKPKAATQPTEGLALGAKPADAHDPQAAKFEAQAGPPHWEQPGKAQKAKVAPPPDGMTSADEQRQRAAEVEAHGGSGVTDQRPDDEKPTFDPHALAGGGAFVRAGKQTQIPGVAPPAKRS
jgi:hypothetical protein